MQVTAGLTLAALLALSAPTTESARAAAGPVRVADLDNQLVDPLQTPAGVSMNVLVFTSVECPISNHYAPVVDRLHRQFGSDGVRFWLVYPNPADTVDAIRTHVREFGYTMRALRDPDHDLAAMAGATVTPEAAVFDRGGQEIYRGRIDNQYEGIGVSRPSPTKTDLADAITAALAGTPVQPATTQAVGCFIADFIPLP